MLDDIDVILDYRPGLDQLDSRKSDYSKSLNASAGVNSAIKVTNRQARYNFARLPGQTIVSTGLDGDGTGNFRIKISGVVDLTAADFIL